MKNFIAGLIGFFVAACVSCLLLYLNTEMNNFAKQKCKVNYYSTYIASKEVHRNNNKYCSCERPVVENNYLKIYTVQGDYLYFYLNSIKKYEIITRDIKK